MKHIPDNLLITCNLKAEDITEVCKRIVILIEWKERCITRYNMYKVGPETLSNGLKGLYRFQLDLQQMHEKPTGKNTCQIL